MSPGEVANTTGRRFLDGSPWDVEKKIAASGPILKKKMR
jgi:hypothetical protein